MKKQLLIGARNSIRYLCAAMLFGTALSVVSCNDDDPNADRGEFIRVYSEPDGEPGDGGYVSVTGVDAEIYVRSNVEYDIYWQDNEDTPWIEVAGREKNFKPGLDRITLKVEPRADYCYYTRRGGTLLLSSPANNFGKFVTIYQGAVERVGQAFAWLTYGSADPLIPDGERAYTGWTDIQKNYGWTTTTPAYCFGKNGYVKLGDDQGHGADLTTPFSNDMRSDSLLMVSFRAVAYNDENGSDNGKLTVNILGGGVFLDTGLTTREITLGTYLIEDGAVSGSMWKDSNYLLFIAKTNESAITGNTQIQFVAGNNGTENNRIFMDNIYVYTLNDLNDDMIAKNKGTDKDIIMGPITADKN